MPKTVAVTLELKKKGMVTSLTDVKSAWDAVTGAVKSFGSVVDGVMERSQRYNNLLRNNSISIDLARNATKGLVKDMNLLAAANTAAEFKMGLTAKQFAVFAKAAVVQSQKLGIDATKALDDLLLGTARGSRRILDNLGFVVREGATVADVVAEINRKVGSQEAAVEGAAGAWAQFKIQIDNSKNILSELGTLFDGDRRIIQEWTGALKLGGDVVGILSGRINALSKEATNTMGSMLALMATIPGMGGAAGEIATTLGSLRKAMRRAGVEQHGMVLADHERLLKQAQGLLKGAPGPAAPGKGKGAGVTGAGPYGYGAGAKGRAQLQLLEGGLAESEARGRFAAEGAASRDEVKKTIDNYRKLVDASNKAKNADLQFVDAQQKKLAGLKELNAGLKNVAFGGLADLAAGTWAAADAAIVGSESFGMAMAKMVKATLLGIAQQATVKAVFNLAEAAAQWFNPVAVSSHLTAAALYGSIAVGSGAAGLGVSAGIKAAGGYDRDSRSRKRASSQDTYRPTFGSRRETERPNVYVQVYLTNNPDDPGAALLQTAHIRKSLARAA